MAGRRPIFASLVHDTYMFIRDHTFKMILEPKQGKPKKKTDNIDDLKKNTNK
ncbi:hypothetical protein [Reichenbachiella ulvae]|uniref:Uncharacterized protein n=1 Tax=Reichenbachiella ulvae TaxID=2980104 RepID=A0ABT3CU70_9BACT|nr:hypothetical protein [Reichenbachiella ulvae]MCV9387069.1 hypothetical protein [Reichenbachiella ulvae]